MSLIPRYLLVHPAFFTNYTDGLLLHGRTNYFLASFLYYKIYLCLLLVSLVAFFPSIFFSFSLILTTLDITVTIDSFSHQIFPHALQDDYFFAFIYLYFRFIILFCNLSFAFSNCVYLPVLLPLIIFHLRILYLSAQLSFEYDIAQLLEIHFTVFLVQNTKE